MTDRRTLRLLGGSVAALPLLTLLFLPIRTIDDAFITFRYARNLAQGNGLVFNLGERVEGITSLSWTLLLAGVEALRLPVEPAAFLLGVTFALLALREAYLLGRGLGASPAACLTAVALVAVHGRFWLVAANGLEGGLFAFLAALVTRKTVDRADPRLIGLLLGLLFMTRPESLLVLPVALLYEALGGHVSARSGPGTRVELTARTVPSWRLEKLCGRLRRRPAGTPAHPVGDQFPARQRSLTAASTTSGRRSIAIAVAALAVAFAVTVWRLAWYGAPLPNSVTAKSVLAEGPDALLANLAAGLSYTVRFEIAHLPLILGAAFALVLAPKAKALWFCLLVVAAELPAVLMNGGDWMPHYRLLTVFAPVLAAPLAVCLSSAFEDWDTPGADRRRAAWVLAVLAASALFMLSRSPWQTTPGPRFTFHPITSCYQFMATRLKPHLAPDDIAAAEAVGLFGWILDETTIHDPLGLVDAHHARHGEYHLNWGKTDYDHLHRVRPAVLVLHEGSVVTPEKIDRGTDGRFADDYSAWFVGQQPPCAPYRLIVYIDNARLERVRPALTGLVIEPLGTE
ncbi:MAG: hypothetical protein OXU63_07740 [Acidobacteriota bacterium]|nr:hypothetical protein [Acidobacteriota bacterium]